MTQHTLVDGDVKKALLRFTMPFLAATLLQFLYGAADLMIVGKFGDAAGVAAVSTGSQIMSTVTGLILGLASGGTVIVGQFWGAGRRHDTERTIGTMFTFFTIFAVVMTLIVTLCTNLIVDLMRVPAQAIPQARSYTFICGCGILFITGYNMVSGILRGLGDSKRPMIFVAIACATNVLGDLLLVGVFRMGAAGAAIATVSAQGLSLLMAVLVLRKNDFPFDFKPASFKVAGDKLLRLLRIGTPVSIENILVGVSFLIITAIVNGFGEVVPAAAVGTAGRISDFCMLGPIAFFSSISAMTAQNIGAGRDDRAKQVLKYGIAFSLIFGVVMFALIELFPETAMWIFNKDTAVIEAGVAYLRSFSFDCILVCFVFALNGFFGGCGRTAFTMVNCLVSTFLVRVPVVFVMSKIFGMSLFHIGLAAPLASLLQILIQLVYLKKGRWRGGSVTADAIEGDS